MEHVMNHIGHDDATSGIDTLSPVPPTYFLVVLGGIALALLLSFL
jgi:hypothetical protein